MIDFYTAHTPNGRKVWIMLEELGIPYKLHEIDLKKGEQKTPQFLAMNPNGRIPVIVDNSAIDSVTVFESAAILYYLASKYEGRFFGYGLDERTHVMEWMMFQMSAVGPNFGNLNYGLHSMEPKNPAFIERFEKESIRIVGVLETQLGKNDYLAGGNYTIADICTYPWVAGMMERQPQVFADAPKLKQWVQKISERPAVKKGMA